MAAPFVCILDYGSGNVASVRNLIEALRVDVAISNTPAMIRDASHLILPGVGAFAAAMRKIGENLPLADIEREVLERSKPFLGICVGMQVLATRGLEFGEEPGLGWIPGTVQPLNGNGLRLPHIGWNDIRWQQARELGSGLEGSPDFYFLHSYALCPDDPSVIAATASYGEEFCAVVRSNNIVGAQFHPEKSQRAGMVFLQNFLALSVKKKRLIPVLLLRDGSLVQSRGFKRYQNLGNPTSAVKRLSEWASDELIYLDISRDNVMPHQRDDLGHPNRRSILEIIADVAKVTFMPITVGGRISTLEAIEERLRLGADKISINTSAVQSPKFVEQAVREFGSQCIVVSIDALKRGDSHEVFTGGGTVGTGLDPVQWARRVESLGAGEILIDSIDRDGTKGGYDLALVGSIADAVAIPVIACGGVGEWSHFADALRQTAVDGVAAANIFHHSDQSVYRAREYLHGLNLNVRSPALLNINAA